MSIKNGHYVECIYTLYNGVDNRDEKLEMATEEAPFKFIVGLGLAMPSFEQKLEGLNEGDEFDFNLAPEEAFGDIKEDLIMKLEKTIFKDEEGNFDEEHIVEGNTIPMRTTDGQVVHGEIIEVGDEYVEMDFNHPFAGLPLHFVGKIVVAREATEQDQAYIYAQMQGHGGCGCGCGGDCHSDEGCGSGSDSSCGCGGGCGCHH